MLTCFHGRLMEQGSICTLQSAIPSCFIAKNIFKSSVLLSKFILSGLIAREFLFGGQFTKRGEYPYSVHNFSNILKGEQTVKDQKGLFIVWKCLS